LGVDLTYSDDDAMAENDPLRTIIPHAMPSATKG
jgi:hypothetical protein